jgi:excisionase family DNA binding protein
MTTSTPASADPRLLYSVRAAADQLSITPWLVYQLINEGVIKSVVLGRRRLVTAEALTDYVERLKAAS